MQLLLSLFLLVTIPQTQDDHVNDVLNTLQEALDRVPTNHVFAGDQVYFIREVCYKNDEAVRLIELVSKLEIRDMEKKCYFHQMRKSLNLQNVVLDFNGFDFLLKSLDIVNQDLFLDLKQYKDYLWNRVESDSEIIIDFSPLPTIRKALHSGTIVLDKTSLAFKKITTVMNSNAQYYPRSRKFDLIQTQFHWSFIKNELGQWIIESARREYSTMNKSENARVDYFIELYNSEVVNVPKTWKPVSFKRDLYDIKSKYYSRKWSEYGRFGLTNQLSDIISDLEDSGNMSLEKQYAKRK